MNDRKILIQRIQYIEYEKDYLNIEELLYNAEQEVVKITGFVAGAKAEEISNYFPDYTEYYWTSEIFET